MSLDKIDATSSFFQNKILETAVRDLGAGWTEALARADSKRGRPHAVCCGCVLERLASTAYAQPRTAYAHPPAALGGKRPKPKNEGGGGERGGWVLLYGL
jgi:hypothetical protein